MCSLTNSSYIIYIIIIIVLMCAFIIYYYTYSMIKIVKYRNVMIHIKLDICQQVLEQIC